MSDPKRRCVVSDGDCSDRIASGPISNFAHYFLKAFALNFLSSIESLASNDSLLRAPSLSSRIDTPPLLLSLGVVPAALSSVPLLTYPPGADLIIHSRDFIVISRFSATFRKGL